MSGHQLLGSWRHRLKGLVALVGSYFSSVRFLPMFVSSWPPRASCSRCRDRYRCHLALQGLRGCMVFWEGSRRYGGWVLALRSYHWGLASVVFSFVLVRCRLIKIYRFLLAALDILPSANDHCIHARLQLSLRASSFFKGLLQLVPLVVNCWSLVSPLLLFSRCYRLLGYLLFSSFGSIPLFASVGGSIWLGVLGRWPSTDLYNKSWHLVLHISLLCKFPLALGGC